MKIIICSKWSACCHALVILNFNQYDLYLECCCFSIPGNLVYYFQLEKKTKTRNHMVETKMIYQYEIMFAMKCFYAKENVQVAINVVCSALCTTGFEPETKRERASDLYIKDTIALENIVKHSLRTYDYNAVYLRLWDSNWRPDN